MTAEVRQQFGKSQLQYTSCDTYRATTNMGAASKGPLCNPCMEHGGLIERHSWLACGTSSAFTQMPARVRWTGQPWHGVRPGLCCWRDFRSMPGSALRAGAPACVLLMQPAGGPPCTGPRHRIPRTWRSCCWRVLLTWRCWTGGSAVCTAWHSTMAVHTALRTRYTACSWAAAATP